MSEAKNPVPIYQKITRTIDETNTLANSGIRRIEGHLRKEFEEFIRKSLCF